MNVNAA